MALMVEDAYKTSMELGKFDDMTEEERREIARIVGMGALKYFILKVDARKNMLFNPEESIDFNGNTGPFIQYTHARICSILRKAAEQGIAYGVSQVPDDVVLSPKEVRLVKLLSAYPQKVQEAADALSPAIIANYAYDLAKEFNQYYHDTPILREEDPAVLKFRLELISVMARTLRCAMGILGIQLPDRM
jgi:arginyl-tRNA synthetase